MNENKKTLAFIAVAAVALGAAWMGKPRSIGVDTPDKVGQILFPELTDPLQARRMEIVEFLPDSGEVRDFKVEQKDGLWVLPSQQNYPADAEENLKQAATALVDLTVINVASEKKSDHETFGVVRPETDKTDIGDEGVGKLVTVRDDTGKVLAEITIGKEVQGQEGQRYVRAGDLDQVFVVKIDPSKMSTKFEDWVQRDVLDLDGWDIEQMVVKDYSINPTFNRSTGQIAFTEEPRLNMTVEQKDATWSLGALEEFRGNTMQPTELLPNEELDNDVLNTMKNTLDELKIVDVEAKPPGLVSGASTTSDAEISGDGLQRLFDNGFYPTDGGNRTIKLRSSDGEVQVRTKNGIQYTLWFGGIAGIEQETTESKLNRYVMVQATVHENAFEKPVLELTEEEMASATETDNEAAAEAPSETDMADEPPAEEAADENGESAAAETTSDPAESASEAEATEQDDAETEPEDAETDGKPESDSSTTLEDKPASDAIQAERDRKLKEYDRAMDEYNDKIREAKEKVQELNYRFADWYYVVSEDEYRKIHLSRSDVVTESEEAAAEGTDVDAFRMLEERGLQSESS